jgi:membrane protein YdbS with pleckstrin-like domain
MRRHSLLRGRIWMLVPLAVVLIAGHGIVLYYFSTYLALSVAVVSVIVLVVLKHVGLLGSLYNLLRHPKV